MRLLAFAVFFFFQTAWAEVLLGYHVPTDDPESNRFLQQTVAGISERFSLDKIEIDWQTSAESLIARAASKQGVILLGPVGLRLAPRLEQAGIPVVTGYNAISPDTTPGISGVSVHTDLDRLLRFTRLVLPDRTNLFYIEDVRQTFFIEHARRRAKQYGYRLEVLTVRYGSDTERVLDDLLPRLGKRDILLLPLSVDVMAQFMYEPLLVKAWSMGVPMISHMFRYAVQGVLIGTYPDPVSYGRQIADLLSRRMRSTTWTPTVELVRDPLLSYNDIYGARFGIELSKQLKKQVSRFIPRW